MVDAESLIHTSVSSRLVYCNVLLSGLRVQVLNVLKWSRMPEHFYHTTPILTSIHWLPIHVRPDFNIWLLKKKNLKWAHPFIPVWSKAGPSSSGISSMLISDNLTPLRPFCNTFYLVAYSLISLLSLVFISMFVLLTRILWTFWKPLHLSNPLLLFFDVPQAHESPSCVPSALFSVSLPIFSLFFSFHSRSCTIGHAGISVPTLAVGASFQMFWIWIIVLKDIQLLSLSPSPCVCFPSPVCGSGFASCVFV